MKLTATTQTLEIALGEAIVATEPDYQIETMEVVAATLVPITDPSGMVKGTFTGTSWITGAVAAPGSANQKGVTRLSFCNRDSIAHTLKMRLNDSSSYTYLLDGLSVPAGGTLTFDGNNWNNSDGTIDEVSAWWGDWWA